MMSSSLAPLANLQLQTMKAAFASLASIRTWMAGTEGKAGPSECSPGRWRPHLTRGVDTTTSFSRVCSLLPSLLASADHSVTFRKQGGY